MGDKVYTLVISVDLSCCRCRRAIQHYLCKLQREQCNRILSIVFDEKNNVVLVSGPFDAEQLKRRLLCKFPKIINGIEIREPPKPKPPDPKPPPDPDREKFMKKCMEKYEKIKKCTEKCKKECEEKCRKECKKKILCKCKSKCDCDCDCDCEKPPKCPERPKCPEPPERPEPPKCPEPPEPPVCPWPPQPPQCPWPPQPPLLPCPRPPIVVCCSRPCPCFCPWSRSFKCCSCGVKCWPGPSPCGRSQWGNSESIEPRNIMFESSAPPCSIM